MLQAAILGLCLGGALGLKFRVWVLLPVEALGVLAALAVGIVTRDVAGAAVQFCMASIALQAGYGLGLLGCRLTLSLPRQAAPRRG